MYLYHKTNICFLRSNLKLYKHQAVFIYTLTIMTIQKSGIRHGKGIWSIHSKQTEAYTAGNFAAGVSIVHFPYTCITHDYICKHYPWLYV